MAKCKPVTLNQLVGGQHYINVAVALNGSMWLETFTHCGRPFIDTVFDLGWMIRVRPLNEVDDLLHDSIRHAASRGLLPLERENEHRVFRFTAKNHALLRDLVGRRALLEYLALIGIENPQETIAQNQRYLRELEEPSA